MEKLIQHMIHIIESNAQDNKAVIPDVEAWAIAWREEMEKQRPKSWSKIWTEWIANSTKLGTVDFFEYLESNYHPPVKKEAYYGEESDN